MQKITASCPPAPAAPDSFQTAPDGEPAPSTAVVPAPADPLVRKPDGKLIKGHPGLPGAGRKVGLAARVRAMMNDSPDKAIETLMAIAWGKLAPSARIADRIRAVEILLDRGWGKPKDVVQINEGAASARQVVRHMPSDQIEAVLDRLREARREIERAVDADTVEEDAP